MLQFDQIREEIQGVDKPTYNPSSKHALIAFFLSIFIYF